MKKILLPLLLLFPLALSAQNPIIRDQYTADPSAHVFGDRLYLFPSHDIISPVAPERKWFCMADYHVFSSGNLVDWTDHGVILSQENVPWGDPEGYSMWAPDCVEKDGKYYFVFPNAPAGARRGFAVGLAVADMPEGPYVPEKEPIKGVVGIDPCILQASDGNDYLFWSGMGLRGARLSDDMRSLDGESVRLDESFPPGFKEGPFAFERKGKYYLTFPWVQDKTETLAYAMSDRPLGPYEFKGIIMAQSPSACWTNHHSLVEFKGRWYLFYHHNDYSPSFDKNRSVRVDTVSFNGDGSILPVTPTLRGVGVSPASSKIQIDRYSRIYHVAVSLDFLDPDKPFDGWFVRLGRPGTWVEYNQIDFAPASGNLTVRARSEKGCTLLMTLGEDTVIARVELPASSDWKESSFPETVPGGVADIRVSVVEGSVDLDWISF